MSAQLRRLFSSCACGRSLFTLLEAVDVSVEFAPGFVSIYPGIRVDGSYDHWLANCSIQRHFTPLPPTVPGVLTPVQCRNHGRVTLPLASTFEALLLVHLAV